MNNTRRAALAALLDDLQRTGLLDARDRVQDIHDALETLRDDEQDAFDNLPESLQDGERGNAMQDAIGRMDDALAALSDVIEACDLDEAFSAIDDARA